MSEARPVHHRESPTVPLAVAGKPVKVTSYTELR